MKLLKSASAHMPLRLAAWGYNLRRTLRLLWPGNRFPLADTAGTLSCQPLIFVSAGRSGTTLLRSMLAVSGEIAIPPESYALSFAALQYQAMQEQSWYNLVRLIVSLFEGVESFQLWQMNMNPVYVKARSLPPPERSLARVIDLIFLEYAAQHFPEAHLWGDQTIQNAQRLPWIIQTFPQAKYLHVLRDGRDVIGSYLKNREAIPYIDNENIIEFALGRWRGAVQAAAHAKKQLAAAQFLEIRYEDLVQSPEPTLQRVCDFAGMTCTPQMLNYWQSDTTVEDRYQTFHQNLKKPVFASSIGSWQERLSDTQKATVQRELASLLTQTGYQ
jgi:LPS sulfotransferase NodH